MVQKIVQEDRTYHLVDNHGTDKPWERSKGERNAGVPQLIENFLLRFFVEGLKLTALRRASNAVVVKNCLNLKVSKLVMGGRRRIGIVNVDNRTDGTAVPYRYYCTKGTEY